MWFFTKKKKVKEQVRYDIGAYMTVDIHSHLLPGIDDGSPDTATSIRLINGLTAKGIQKIITSPHVMADIHKNTPESIQQANNTLMPALQAAAVTVPFSYGAEYLLDEQFIDKLQNGQLLPLFDNYLLVETPFLYRPFNLEDHIFQIQAAGYIPILAHPERYLYMFSEQELFFKMKNLGCKLQLNVLSLTGYYGKSEKDCAKFLLDNNLYEYFGTDMHHERHLRNFTEFRVDEDVARLLDKNYNLIRNRDLLQEAVV